LGNKRNSGVEVFGNKAIMGVGRGFVLLGFILYGVNI